MKTAKPIQAPPAPITKDLKQEARMLPTAVLEEVLRERREAERKARRLARDRRDGYLVPLTEADKQTMRDAWERMGTLTLADTPGRKATYPILNKARTNIISVPVVVLCEHNGQHLTRLSDKAITLLPADWPLDFVSDEEWTQTLADFGSAQEAA